MRLCPSVCAAPTSTNAEREQDLAAGHFRLNAGCQGVCEHKDHRSLVRAYLSGFLLDDPSSRFFDIRVTALGQLRQEG
jgi:hypothetical protein